MEAEGQGAAVLEHAIAAGVFVFPAQCIVPVRAWVAVDPPGGGVRAQFEVGA